MAWPCSLAAVAVLAMSCSDNGRSAPSSTSGESGRRTPSPVPAVPMVYVAVGASDAVGYGADHPATEAWPQVLLRTALPPRSELVNLGIPGATVATALERELPEALRREPTLVTVWLNVNDLMASVPVETYERRLGELVGALRRGGRSRVLVANTPPLDRLPVYVACQGDSACLGGSLPGPDVVRGAVEAYNAAISRVVAAEDAELVDLHGTGLAARAAGRAESLVSSDGFHPSTAGHAAVAEAFAAVVAAAPPAQPAPR